MPKGSHAQFLLLLDASGADAGMVDAFAQEIHDAYMAEFGGFGAFTLLLLRLDHRLDEGTVMHTPTSWTHAIRYFGPRKSVGWLRDRIGTTFSRQQLTPDMLTFETSDITGRY